MDYTVKDGPSSKNTHEWISCRVARRLSGCPSWTVCPSPPIAQTTASEKGFHPLLYVNRRKKAQRILHLLDVILKDLGGGEGEREVDVRPLASCSTLSTDRHDDLGAVFLPARHQGSAGVLHEIHRLEKMYDMRLASFLLTPVALVKASRMSFEVAVPFKVIG